MSSPRLYLRWMAHSTKQTDQRRKHLEVKELLASNTSSHTKEEMILTRLRSSDTENGKEWNLVTRDSNETKQKHKSGHGTFLLQKQLEAIPKKAMSLLLPVKYPYSVANGYLGFVSFCFTASIAGSASMVLSTQTLLLAVGIVGQTSSGSAGLMAGALNWVMKDFIGQLGGIMFASKMGKTKAFDSDPKRWRMVAATALDGATLLEILSPLCHSSLVLPIASVANIGKNIGFLTASASRASLHQSLAVSGNLGDVTVKSGSQSMLASLVGTSLGIGLSTVLDHDFVNFGICFVCLSAIHQGCTYLSLQNVPLAHFNRNRLHLAMEYYIQNNQTTPSPVDIAKIEKFVPALSCDSSKEWLHIGRPLRDVCPTPNEFENCLACAPNEAYLVRIDKNTEDMDLIYFHEAKKRDIFRGLYHACLIRHHRTQQRFFDEGVDGEQSCTLDEQFQNITRQAHIQVQNNSSNLLNELQTKGWNTSSAVADVEDEKAYRIQFDRM